MTTEELAKLTLEEKRAKIAEACPELVNHKGPVVGELYWLHNGRCTLFDPYGDLNAMHAALASQSREFQVSFQAHLLDEGKLSELTAADWADRFLLQLNADGGKQTNRGSGEGGERMSKDKRFRYGSRKATRSQPHGCM